MAKLGTHFSTPQNWHTMTQTNASIVAFKTHFYLLVLGDALRESELCNHEIRNSISNLKNKGNLILRLYWLKCIMTKTKTYPTLKKHPKEL